MNMIDRPRLALLRHHGCHGAPEVSSFAIREERIGRARIDRARILAAPFQPKCRVPTSIVERSIVDGHTRSGLNLASYVFDTLPDRIDNLENFVVFSRALGHIMQRIAYAFDNRIVRPKTVFSKRARQAFRQLANGQPRRRACSESVRLSG